MSTNRVIVFLDAPEARLKRRIADLKARCEALTEETGDIVEFFVDCEGSVRMFLNSEEFGMTLPSNVDLRGQVIQSLRSLSELCTATAEAMEGGAA